MMTTVTLPLSELDRRAAAVHATLELLRFEVERDAIFVGGCYYHWVAKREVKKLERALARSWNLLRTEQLREVADILGEANAIAEPHIADGHRLSSSMRWFERQTFAAFCRLVQRVDGIRLSMLDEANRRDSAAALFEGPRLTAAQSRHVMIAKAVFRPVHRDPAEALHDPDYGF